MLGWISSLAGLVTFPLESVTPGLCILVGLAVLWRAWLCTGLFITAHDAMHGNLLPHAPCWNHRLGALALLLYALLPYQHLRRAHLSHHRSPGTEFDPDFSSDRRFLPWLGQFLWHYGAARSGLGLALVYALAHWFLGVAWVNLLLFCVLPAWLSAVQLFYFGTYLPHRQVGEIRTIGRSPLWSLLSCYHFGLHAEHHAYPQIPWWGLTAVMNSGPAKI
jgi:beta-carotene/zeaxanthin 4-ketolase